MGYNKYIGTRHNERHVMEQQRTHNTMVSSYPANFHADALTRINRLRNTEFPISADQYLRMLRKREQGFIAHFTEPAEHLTSVATGTGEWA